MRGVLCASLASFAVRVYILLSVLATSGCLQNVSQRAIKLSGKAQGTTYQITYLGMDTLVRQSQVDSILNEIDQSLSTYNPNSIISRINNNENGVVADKYFTDVFRKAMEIAKDTDGAFDPTISPLVEAWGFGSGNQGENQQPPDSATALWIKTLVNYKNVQLTKNSEIQKGNPLIQLDFNGIAQGYSVDVLSEFIKKKGVKNYLVELGGEVRASGQNVKEKPWSIGIDKPKDGLAKRELHAVITLSNKSLATSGSYRNYWEENGQKYSHIIDPKTGFPAKNNVLSVTVITENCMEADAYATAFMVMGLDGIKEFLKKEMAIELFVVYDENGQLKEFRTDGLDIIIL